MDELQKPPRGPLMSPCNPCDLQTPLLKLDAPVCGSGTTQQPLIMLVGVLTTINPLLTPVYVVWKIKSGCGFNIRVYSYMIAQLLINPLCWLVIIERMMGEQVKWRQTMP